MNRRNFMTTSMLGAVGTLTGNAQQVSPAPAGHYVPEPAIPERPNVIWIFGDQFRAQALPFNGDPNSRTPNLERAESMA